MRNLFHLLRSMIRIKPASILKRVVLFVFLSSISLSLFANQLYRYKNDNGQLVLSQTLPAQYAGKGYEILNHKGRVIKTIAPALTPKQIAQRDAELERKRLALIAKQKQDAIDEELKQLYSQPNDAVRVLSRRILDIENVIKIKFAKIKNSEAQIIDVESQAAQRQRKGLSIKDDSINTLQSLKKEIELTYVDIQELHNELNKVTAEFDKKIKRLEVITKQTASDYPEALKAVKRVLSFNPLEE